jgi:hypothetical protein
MGQHQEAATVQIDSPKRATTKGLVTLTAIAALAVGSLSACASSSAASHTVPTGSPTPAPSSSIQPGGPNSLAPSASGAPQKFQALGWTSSGDVLTVSFYAGICEKYGLQADQSTPGRIVVTVVVTQKHTPGQMCPMVILEQHVSTDLGSPVGGRTVVDSATGRDLPELGGVASGGHFYSPGPLRSSGAVPD